MNDFFLRIGNWKSVTCIYVILLILIGSLVYNILSSNMCSFETNNPQNNNTTCSTDTILINGVCYNYTTRISKLQISLISCIVVVLLITSYFFILYKS